MKLGQETKRTIILVVLAIIEVGLWLWLNGHTDGSL